MKNFTDTPIVAPVDFSDEADRAVECAIELSCNSAHVTVVHVLTPLVIAGPMLAYDVTIDETRNEQWSEALKKRYAALKYQGVNFNVRVGDPGVEIVEFATELKAGLIIMPSHG